MVCAWRTAAEALLAASRWCWGCELVLKVWPELTALAVEGQGGGGWYIGTGDGLCRGECMSPSAKSAVTGGTGRGGCAWLAAEGSAGAGSWEVCGLCAGAWRRLRELRRWRASQLWALRRDGSPEHMASTAGHYLGEQGMLLVHGKSKDTRKQSEDTGEQSKDTGEQSKDTRK